jgi:hypothetical protein
MSNKWYEWARTQKAGGGSAKSVLFYLAERANDDGLCWPSIGLIVGETEISESVVKRSLKILQEKNLLTKINKGNQHISTYYQIGEQVKSTPSDSESVKSTLSSGEQVKSTLSDNRVNRSNRPSEQVKSTSRVFIKEPSLNHQRNNNTPPTTEEGVVVVIQKNPDFFFSFETMWEKANPQMDERDCFKNWNEIDLDLLLYYSNEGEISPKSADFKDLISRSATNATKSPRAYLLSLLKNGKLTPKDPYDHEKRKENRYL